MSANSDIRKFNFYFRYPWTQNDFANLQQWTFDTIGALGQALPALGKAALQGLAYASAAGMVVTTSAGIAANENGEMLVLGSSAAVTATSNATNPVWHLVVLRPTKTDLTPVPNPSSPSTTVNLHTKQGCTVTLVAGTPAASPAYPAATTGDVILYGLKVPANTTTITNAMVDVEVRDARDRTTQLQLVNAASPTKAVRHNAPVLANSYDLTWPTGLPSVAGSVLQWSTTGVASFYDLFGSANTWAGANTFSGGGTLSGSWAGSPTFTGGSTKAQVNASGSTPALILEQLNATTGEINLNFVRNGALAWQLNAMGSGGSNAFGIYSASASAFVLQASTAGACTFGVTTAAASHKFLGHVNVPGTLFPTMPSPTGAVVNSDSAGNYSPYFFHGLNVGSGASARAQYGGNWAAPGGGWAIGSRYDGASAGSMVFATNFTQTTGVISASDIAGSITNGNLWTIGPTAGVEGTHTIRARNTNFRLNAGAATAGGMYIGSSGNGFGSISYNGIFGTTNNVVTSANTDTITALVFGLSANGASGINCYSSGSQNITTGTNFTFSDTRRVFSFAPNSGILGASGSVGPWDIIGQIRVLDSGGTGTSRIEFNPNSTGGIYVSGACMATGSGATLLWNTSSGYFVYVASSLRYKTDLADFNGGLSLVKQLKPFYYTPVYDAKAREIGLAAEHVAELLPQIVTWKEYEVDGITKNLPESLDYARLTPVLASAIQELYGEFDERLSTLEKSFAERNAS